jgi:hypothetical protein
LLSLLTSFIVGCGDNLESTTSLPDEIDSLWVTKTGQTVSYAASDDGEYQKGLDRNFSRDNTLEVITDNVRKIQWQDNNVTVVKNYVDAIEYCNDLIFANFSDWSLPSIQQLISVVNISGGSSKLETVFVNYTTSMYYWSNTSRANSATDAWALIYSTNALHSSMSQETNNSVKCLREFE